MQTEPGNEPIWDSLVRLRDINSVPSPNKWVIENRVNTVRENGRQLYPILTAPVTGKDQKQFRCPESHLAFAREFLKTCRRFLVIGNSGYDDDLHEFLQDSVDQDTTKALHFVGSDDVETAMARFRQSTPMLFKYQANRPQGFSVGFQGYVSSDHFPNFARIRL
jgi:hypothetical protein